PDRVSPVAAVSGRSNSARTARTGHPILRPGITTILPGRRSISGHRPTTDRQRRSHQAKRPPRVLPSWLTLDTNPGGDGEVRAAPAARPTQRGNRAAGREESSPPAARGDATGTK